MSPSWGDRVSFSPDNVYAYAPGEILFRPREGAQNTDDVAAALQIVNRIIDRSRERIGTDAPSATLDEESWAGFRRIRGPGVRLQIDVVQAVSELRLAGIQAQPNHVLFADPFSGNPFSGNPFSGNPFSATRSPATRSRATRSRATRSRATRSPATPSPATRPRQDCPVTSATASPRRPETASSPGPARDPALRGRRNARGRPVARRSPAAGGRQWRYSTSPSPSPDRCRRSSPAATWYRPGCARNLTRTHRAPTGTASWTGSQAMDCSSPAGSPRPTPTARSRCTVRCRTPATAPNGRSPGS